ncbi:hypothetical protein ACTXT7_003254 [Hymenolepis weldensis]
MIRDNVPATSTVQHVQVNKIVKKKEVFEGFETKVGEGMAAIVEKYKWKPTRHIRLFSVIIKSDLRAITA